MRIDDWIDVKGGIAGGLLMGAAVTWINFSHGLGAASIAGLKQAIYTFFFGGAVLQLCARIACWQGPRGRAIAAAILLPSIVTSTAIFIVHNLRGTPEPLLSCLPVVIVSPPGFAWQAWRIRRIAVTG